MYMFILKMKSPQFCMPTVHHSVDLCLTVAAKFFWSETVWVWFQTSVCSLYISKMNSSVQEIQSVNITLNLDKLPLKDYDGILMFKEIFKGTIS